MNRTRSLLLLAVCALAPAPVLARQAAGGSFRELLVAGTSADFAQVRHVRIAGSQREIGRRLAELAGERHGAAPRLDVDPRRSAAQRRYFERNAPFFLERMRGVADAFEVELTDDGVNVAALSFGFVKPGCTVVYYPPAWTEWGTGVVSRNFDFTTGTFRGQRPGPEEVAVCSSPYVLELYPDQGYASLSICAYDLLGGVVDGINSEGLTVALLADDEAMQTFPLVPADGPQAGFGVVQIGRHLLETCATVEEAQAALLEAKLYYTSIPCHYLIADRHGESFVWENSPFLTQGFVFEGEGEPQVTTNFLYHLHPDRADLPAESAPSGSFNRYRRVWDELPRDGSKVDLDTVRAANACVAATGSAPAPGAPGRTLWHALYFPAERRLEVDFYLGEDTQSGVRRSGYLEFELQREAEGAAAVR